MPLITFSTNLLDSQIPPDFGQDFINFLAEIWNKPTKNFVLNLESSKQLSIGGSSDPAVLLVVGYLC